MVQCYSAIVSKLAKVVVRVTGENEMMVRRTENGIFKYH